MISNTSEGQWCPGAEGDKPDNSSSCAENPQTSTRFPSTGYAATCKPETASAGAPAPDRGKPILFSAPMIRALLEGRKTQDRQALKPQPYALEGRPGFWNASGCVGGRICISDRALLDLHAKARPGDSLWLREAWHSVIGYDRRPPREIPEGTPILYCAGPHEDSGWTWGRPRPAKFMPRWASRLTLIVENVKVERLQEISEADAIAEGMQGTPGLGDFPAEWDEKAARRGFRSLWNDIHGEGAWAANPWVCAITFRVIRANIDALSPSPKRGR